VEADNILVATTKAQKSEAWTALSPDERAAIESAQRELEKVYHANDHHAINAKVDALNNVTLRLAENMMNTAVRGALKGTKIE